MAGIEAGGYRQPPRFPEGDLFVNKQPTSSMPHLEEDVGADLPTLLPKISLPAMPAVKAMQTLLETGKVIAEIQEGFSGFPALTEAVEALGQPMSAVADALPQTSVAPYLGMAGGALGIVALGAEYRKMCDEIKELKSKLGQSEAQDVSLKAQIKEISARRSSLEVESGVAIVKLGLTGVKHAAPVVGSLATDLPQVSQVFGVVGAFAGSVASAAGLGLAGMTLNDNRKLAEKIPEVRQEAIDERDKAPLGLKRKILDFRVRNLNKQEEENRVGIVKSSIALASSIFGTIAGTKVLLVALGITVGVAVGVSLAGLGVAAAVLAGVGLAIGIGYLIYKNRFAIQHAYEMAPKIIGEQFKALKIKILSAQAESARDEIAYTEKKLDPHRYDSRSSSIQSKLAKKTEEKNDLLQRNEKAGFFERMGNYLHIFVLKAEIYSLTHGKEQVEMKTSDMYVQRHRSIQQLSADAASKLDKKIVAIQQRIADSRKEREQMQKDYKVYQHLGKFGEGVDEKEIEELFMLHAEVEKKSGKDFKNMGIMVQDEANSDECWDAVIQFATQAVAA